MDAWAIVGMGATVLLGLIAWVWNRNARQVDRQDKTLLDHDQRITRLEGSMQTAQNEIATLRHRWHDMRAEVTHSMAKWWDRVVEMVRRGKPDDSL